jgi:GNAT superfamily N-acetyltransferase
MLKAIRPALPADVPAMHRIRTKVAENQLADPGRVVEDSYLPYLAAGSAWVAETDAGLAGFAVLDAAKRSVWALFVHPDLEGAGIGGALHDHMLGWAREQGLRQLELTTGPGTRAELFYARRGWTRAGLTANGEQRFEMRLDT